MLCWCWEKNVEKKTITKPLLAESKSLTGEPKVIERKLTGFEPPLLPSPLPSPKPEPVSAPAPAPAPAPKPVVPKPEPVVVIEPEPIVIIEPEPIKSLPPKPTVPKPVIQTADPQEQEQEQEPPTLLEKNDFVPREKKNRSKSRR